ncbi:MAG: DUF4173 domain-containing protein [Pyrinomonadaceae bacterium]
MNGHTKTGLQILQVALIVGIAGDLLLRATPWGLNVLLFNLVFVGGMATLMWRNAREQLNGRTIALFGAQLFFASMFVWRDAIELRVADTFAIIAILSVLFLPKMKVAASAAGVFHYIAGFVMSALHAVGAPFVLIFADVEWPSIPNTGWRKHAFSTLRGVAIAAPLIIIFGALFMAADAAFEGLVQRMFNIPADKVFSHLFLFGIFSWLTAGYLRGVLINSSIIPEAAAAAVSSAVSPAKESPVERVRAESGEYPVTLPEDRTVVEHINISDAPNKTAEPKTESTQADEPVTEAPKPWDWADFDNTVLPSSFTLGTVEIGIILGLVNLLFLSFVIVQVPYLFGGMELVQNTPDFKLAEYARRGFGELVAVAGLVLPMLLASHWLIRKETSLAGKLFKAFAGIQITLLFVIMASAVQRLVLLTGELGYGMTTVRLYPLIFMSWLAVVFVWFAATVLRGYRQYFAWGALWSAIFVLGATHFLNPDQFIVNRNIALMQQGREFDAGYNSQLSDDALPALFHAIPDMSESNRETVIYRLANRYCTIREEGHDLRSWNLSRSNAWSMLESNRAFVETLGGCDKSSKFYYRSDHRDMD